MDPMMVSLILAGVRLAIQAAQGVARAQARLSDLEAFMLVLNQEGRAPTSNEVHGFVVDAQDANDNVQQALARLPVAVRGDAA